jgi:hypothetical protein
MTLKLANYSQQNNIHLEEFVQAFPGAKRTGPHRYRAPCPSCGGRSLKLSIADIEGVLVVHCFASCSPEQVLAAVGLTFRNLYPDGPPPTPEQLRQAHADRDVRERWKKSWDTAERDRAARLRQLRVLLSEIASRLAVAGEDDTGDALAVAFHQTLDELREAEAKCDFVVALRRRVEALDAADYARRKKAPGAVAQYATHTLAVAS